MESIPMTIIVIKIVAIHNIVAFLPKRQTGYTSEMLRQMSSTNMVLKTTWYYETCTTHHRRRHDMSLTDDKK